MDLKNEKGITLVALVVSIVVMIILASVTLNTTFAAYQTARVDKFKAQMKVLQECVTNFNTEWELWKEEERQKKMQEDKELDVGSDFESKHDIKNFIDERKKNLKSQDGIIDDKEWINYNLSSLTNQGLIDSVKANFKKVLGKDLDNNVKFYKFEKSNNDFEYYLGARNIDFDTVYINFENMFIFTTSPVKVDGKNVYTQYDFSDTNSINLNVSKTLNSNAYIQIDEIANYGTSKKIKLTLVSPVENSNDEIDYRIKKAYFKKNVMLTQLPGWSEVDDLKECKYSEDGKSVTFIVYETGFYKFRIDDIGGNFTDKMKSNHSLNIKNMNKVYDNDDVYKITLCNSPVLNSNMVPVKWVYDSKEKINGRWVVCSTIDPEWYNYSVDTKMWANVMLIHDKNTTKELKSGIELSETEMGSMFVWVPRFVSDANVLQFCRGITKTSTAGILERNNLGAELKIKGAFGYNGTENCWDSELKGLWFAKYDSGLESIKTDSTGKKIGIEKINTSDISLANNYDKLYTSAQKFYPVSKPYYITWRNISFVNSFSQSLMYYNCFNVDDKNELNSHLMTADEYTILNEISTFGYYGNRWNITSNTSNRFSGGSDGISGYTFQSENINQSSNGNITGIFDIKGTTEVFISDLGILKNAGDTAQYLYNNLSQVINVKEIVSEANKKGNKYYSFGKSDVTEELINVGESISGPSGSNWKKITAAKGDNTGFRIVMANSPAGGIDNLLYDSTNVSTNVDKDDLYGFYVTDDEGNIIKNYAGELVDSNGNPTYFSMEDMKNKGWIKIDSVGTSKTLNAGSNINVLKQKTGILRIDGVQTIGSEAFKNWTKLIKLELSENIKTIGSRAFEMCYNLKEIKFSEGLELIDYYAFHECSSLVNYRLPDSLETIGAYSFKNCRSLEYIVIPNKVSFIRCEAFNGCKNVLELDINSNVETLQLESGCFANLGIVSVTVPGNIKCLYSSSFVNCQNLQNVNIQNGVEEIGINTFSGCLNLKEIVFPQSLIKLGDGETGENGVFNGCTSLIKADFSLTQLTKIPYRCFYGCSSLSNVILPPNLDELGGNCFLNCTNLKSIELPENVYKNTLGKTIFGWTRNSENNYENLYIDYKGSQENWQKFINKNPNWFENISVNVETEEGYIFQYQ